MDAAGPGFRRAARAVMLLDRVRAVHRDDGFCRSLEARQEFGLHDDSQIRKDYGGSTYASVPKTPKFLIFVTAFRCTCGIVCADWDWRIDQNWTAGIAGLHAATLP